jgi:predicted metal-dependent hydrolase
VNLESSKGARDWFRLGIDLFNQGRYFECHEAWEEVWKRTHGPEKLFYQGLIQAAVAILHCERGNLEGAASLYEKARVKLDPLPSEHVGISLAELRLALEVFFKAALDERLPAGRPKIRRTRNRERTD